MDANTGRDVLHNPDTGNSESAVEFRINTIVFSERGKAYVHGSFSQKRYKLSVTESRGCRGYLI